MPMAGRDGPADQPASTGKRLRASTRGQPQAGESAAEGAGQAELTLELLLQREQNPVPTSLFEPLRYLATILHGKQYDPAAVQVPDLLQRWEVLHSYLRQRVAGTHPSEPDMAVSTAQEYLRNMFYCT